MSNFIKKTLACTLAVVICLSCMLGSLTFSAETINGSFVIEETYVTPGTETAEVKITVNAPGANELFMKVETTAGEITAVSSNVGTATINSSSGIINISSGFNLDGFETVTLTVTVDLFYPETIARYPVTATLKSAASNNESIYNILPTTGELLVTDGSLTPSGSENTFGGTYVPNAIADYAPNFNVSSNNSLLNLSTVSIAENVGVDGSCALVYTAGKYETYSGIARQNHYYFQAGKTYHISFMAKKSGTVSDFKFLFKASTGSWASHTLVAAELTDEWVRYSVKLNFDDYGLNNLGHKGWGISCTVGEDSYLYIDDIVIYNVEDPTKTNFYTLGSFDTRKYKISSYEPYGILAYQMSIPDKKDDEGNVIGKDYTEWVHDNNFTAEQYNTVITIAEGGYDGSYALKILGEGRNREVALKMSHTNILAADTTYTVSFKVRASHDNSVSQLHAGLMSRWEWNKKKLSTKLNVSGEETSLSQITTEWTTITGTLTTDSTFRDADTQWHLVYMNFTVSEGVTLYIDDISIKAADCTELFWRGSFDKAIMDWKELDEEPENVLIYTKYNEIGSEVIAIDQAVSGKNVLALGFKDEAVNNRVWFETALVRPRETYKLEMWVMFVGEIDSVSITMGDNDPYDDDTTVDSPESSILFKPSANEINYLPGTWIKIEKIWTDLTTATGNYRWAGLNIALKCPAGSGMLIDSISITPLHDEFEFAPNVFNYKGFEYDYSLEDPDYEWNDTYTTNGDIMDLSFMNDLPKSVGFLGNTLRTNYDQYFDISNKDSDYFYVNTAMVTGTTNLDVVISETYTALKNGREIWLDATSLVCSDYKLTNLWKEKLDKAAYTIESIAGDKFQGVYFDEPGFHFANNDDFIEVTGYIRNTYKKRVFSMCNAGMFRDSYYFPLEDDNPENDNDSTIRVYVSEESHKYVTDIGYWAYTTGSATTRTAAFNTYCAKLDSNVRKWICGLMGVWGTSTTETANINIFNNMINGVKDNNNFGGILLWDTYSTKGYDLLKPDETTGVAEYDNFRHLLMAISDDLRAKDSWVNNGGWISSDNVMVLDSPIMSNEFIESFNSLLQAKLTFYSAGSESSTPEQLVNNLDATILVTSLTTGTNVEYSFALANDVNCDNKVNAVDIVRAKRISAGLVNGDKFSFAAAGSDLETGINITDAARIRTELMK